jgi:voltage-dependent calcium channel alpha-2/delta-4
VNCGRKSLDDDSYYCNKELVELLVFDAKVTNESYQTWTFRSDEDRALVELYDANIRFIGTMSGLTRWQFIFGEVEVDSDIEFGDYHNRSIEETWYQSAIFQHHIEKDSFVYTVPHAEDLKSDNDTKESKVTASMAIFPRDGGLEAPSCVVGFEFSRELMYQRFMEITSKVNVSITFSFFLFLLHSLIGCKFLLKILKISFCILCRE